MYCLCTRGIGARFVPLNGPSHVAIQAGVHIELHTFSRLVPTEHSCGVSPRGEVESVTSPFEIFLQWEAMREGMMYSYVGSYCVGIVTSTVAHCGPY